MSKLGDYIVKIRNKFQHTNYQVPRQTLDFKDAKNIGILFLTEEDPKVPQAINEFVATLKKEGKNLKMLTFIEKLEGNPYNFSYDAFTRKEVSTLGQIKSTAVEQFINARFDYLYCILSKPFPLYESIMQQSQAKCRIGRYFPNQEDNYELMIALDEQASIEKLIQEMLIFTKGFKVNHKTWQTTANS